MQPFELHQGTLPLLISCPHNGTALIDGLAQRLTAAARELPDTDWHIARLYEFTRHMGASVLVPRYSRYVVDLNRAPAGESLYPGKTETGLCPTQMFSGQPIYNFGDEPSADEIQQRVENYWTPYHLALTAEIDRIKQVHGRAVLWEAHSIRSQVPLFFDGSLPDLNIGTADGRSCSAALQFKLQQTLQAQTEFGFVINGRFKGGYITRAYGQPTANIDAVQMEIAQINYMDEDSFAFDANKAECLQKILKDLLAVALQ